MGLCDLGDDGGCRCEPAQAPAGHGPGLGEALDDDRLIAQPRVSLGKALVAVHIDEAVVYVVADYVDARLLRYARHGVERCRVEDAARRIVGRADDDGLGRRRHASTKCVLVNLVLRRLRIQKDRFGVIGHDDALVQAKGRRGDNDLVAGVEHSHKCCRQGLGRAVGQDDLIGGIRKARIPHVGRQRLAQGRATVVGRIMRVTAVERGRHLGANHIGRGKIGLAKRKRDAPRVLGGERVNPADAGGLERGKRGIHGQTHGVPFVRVALG